MTMTHDEQRRFNELEAEVKNLRVLVKRNNELIQTVQIGWTILKWIGAVAIGIVTLYSGWVTMRHP